MKNYILLIALFSALQSQASDGEKLKLGNSKRAKLIHFADGMFYDDCLTFEIGQLIKVKHHKVKINAVNLYLFDSPKDSLTFNIRFYEYKDGKPMERIMNHEIYQTHALQEGWLKMDISDLNIEMNENFVVALVVERNPSESRDINYQVGVMGGAKSYYRKDDQKKWKRPPHSYCMYVDAVTLD